MRAADQPWWCDRLTSALAIREAARRWLAAAFIRLRLDISTPGGHSVNFGLSMLAPAGRIVDNDGTGSGASVRGFTLANGAIVGITIDPGADYGAPQLEITDATGSGAVRDVRDRHAGVLGGRVSKASPSNSRSQCVPKTVRISF
jgi:hypothetical protein